YVSDHAVPVQLSLQRTSAENGTARLVWYSPDGSARNANVYRRAADGDWARRDEIAADGSGFLVYEDRSVVAGQRYGYRLAVDDAGTERMFGEAWVEIPIAARFALEDVTPNPATGP